MPKVLIVYFSHGGNTRKMAEALAASVKAGGCEVSLKKVAEATNDDLRAADGVLLGAPCYFGSMANPMKKFIDDSIPLFGKGELAGKAAGAFASTGGIGGGGEPTILSMLHGLLIHGMVVQGLRKGGHFGPLAIGEPDQRVMDECAAYGAQFAALVNKLAA
ncbi:MAG: NAD(P)H-dependent oxidoreductase [Proteobacteria bacterium]|nr:NAD(P)H-dependent oxidoreductase [Pseudomonadota bacterium]MBU4277950.1 NAD(P)H-dependent oxidoreductase [Pseudomonadota bacterium]MBU4384996.1 NAD(P)H-dependent oxidoreductase [Pseudomonadota bacterium]MBU4604381.1 NAD(P)H-dependent oxidoreductase [Pseudomonadota bacterium]MCG2766131.1 NAD(P)H-dependent oxidoreductase [Desulfarculaceae bacterium]